MGSGETNISALECNEENYYASIESSPENHNSPQPPLILRGGEGELVCESPLAFSGSQCTPDTYVDASDFTPAKKLGLSGHGELIEKPAHGEPVESMTRTARRDAPTVELSDFGPLAPFVAVAALVTGVFGASCGGTAPRNGDGDFDFGEGEGESEGEDPVDDPNDVDGDGYPEDKDCDDTDATVHPRATETPYDGIDQDCNGEDVIDADGDGFIAVEADGDDCNDDQAYIHPGAEQRLTGFDTNCDGNPEIDLDRDSVKFVGENDGDQFGSSMTLGDVNGDGYGDVIVGTGYAADGNGKAYIFFGGAAALVPGSTLYATDADVTITGGCIWLMAGVGASILAKDLNEDGAAELMIGIPGLNSSDCEEPGGTDGSRSGGILVMEGRADWDSSYDFSEIDITDPTALAEKQVGLIKGADGGRIGRNILVTGDIDGDGVGQIVAGRQSSCDVIPARVYEGINRIDEVRDSEGGYHVYNNTGVGFNGTSCDFTASGDINDDGLADLVLADTNDVLGLHDGAGRVSLLMGSESLPSNINLYSLETYSGLKYLQFSGNGPSYGAGSSLALGDVDGDGKDELMIGVRGEDSPMESAGRVYCVPGLSITEVVEGENPVFENGDTIVLNGDVMSLGGLSFYSTFANANMPTSLAVVRTSDEVAGNLLVGAVAYFDPDPSSTEDMRGSRAFYFGSATFDGAGDSEVPVSEATVEIASPGGDSFGGRLTAGDVNVDGVEDVLISASTGPDGTQRGTTYLLFGGAR